MFAMYTYNLLWANARTTYRQNSINFKNNNVETLYGNRIVRKHSAHIACIRSKMYIYKFWSHYSIRFTYTALIYNNEWIRCPTSQFAEF